MVCIDVFLAEDHTVVREGLRQILAQQPDLRVVGEAERGDTAVEAIQRLQPDVVVLDYRLPALNGIEVAAALTEGLVGQIMGTVAVALAAVNVFGGFLVTQRMLEMFKKKEKKAPAAGAAASATEKEAKA